MFQLQSLLPPTPNLVLPAKLLGHSHMAAELEDSSNMIGGRVLVNSEVSRLLNSNIVNIHRDRTKKKSYGEDSMIHDPFVFLITDCWLMQVPC